ncbi:MAG: Flp pilus assembly protein CpaB [Lawsonibacter sp.]
MLKKKKSTKDLVHPEGTEALTDAGLPEENKGRKANKERPERRRPPIRDVVRSRPFLGGLCILAGLLVAFVATPYLQSKIAETAPVVVLKERQPAGTKLTDEMLETKEMGVLNLPKDRLERGDDAAGRYLTVAGAAGDLLTNSRLSEILPGDDPELSCLPTGKLAMSATLASLAQNLSGKLRAGDVIRLYATLDDSGSVSSAEDSAASSMPELQYVEVLAVTNQNARDVVSEQERMGQEVTDSDRQIATVTLAVNERQAAVLAGLEQNGILHAALVVRGDPSQKEKALAAQESYFSQAAEPDTSAPSQEPTAPEGTGDGA